MRCWSADFLPPRSSTECGFRVTGHVPALDGPRGVAVAAVVAYHLRPERIPGGFLGVDLFFVPSG